MAAHRTSSTPHGGFAALARRIAGWTTNLLATGIVLVLTLVVGRQLVVWWRVEPGHAAGASLALAPPLADPGAGQPLELGFGQMPYQIQCRKARGDGQAALDQLTSVCRGLAASGTPLFPVVNEAETGLLKLTSELPPVARGPGEIEVFASGTGMPIVVVTSPAPPAGDAKPAADRVSAADVQATENGAKLGADRRRVITWGLAAAAVAGEWTLYVAHASEGRSNVPSEADPGSAAAHAVVPIPPGSRRSLAMWDVHGGGVSALAGSGRMNDWADFYSAWFDQKPWLVLQPWQHQGGVWHARFERTDGARRETVDVQFGRARATSGNEQESPGGAVELVGLISIAVAESAGK